jgi:hypothetical protein
MNKYKQFLFFLITYFILNLSIVNASNQSLHNANMIKTKRDTFIEKLGGQKQFEKLIISWLKQGGQKRDMAINFVSTLGWTDRVQNGDFSINLTNLIKELEIIKEQINKENESINIELNNNYIFCSLVQHDNLIGIFSETDTNISEDDAKILDQILRNAYINSPGAFSEKNHETLSDLYEQYKGVQILDLALDVIFNIEEQNKLKKYSEIIIKQITDLTELDKKNNKLKRLLANAGYNAKIKKEQRTIKSLFTKTLSKYFDEKEIENLDYDMGQKLDDLLKKEHGENPVDYLMEKLFTKYAENKLQIYYDELKTNGGYAKMDNPRPVNGNFMYDVCNMTYSDFSGSCNVYASIDWNPSKRTLSFFENNLNQKTTSSLADFLPYVDELYDEAMVK